MIRRIAQGFSSSSLFSFATSTLIASTSLMASTWDQPVSHSRCPSRSRPMIRKKTRAEATELEVADGSNVAPLTLKRTSSISEKWPINPRMSLINSSREMVSGFVVCRQPCRRTHFTSSVAGVASCGRRLVAIESAKNLPTASQIAVPQMDGEFQQIVGQRFREVFSGFKSLAVELLRRRGRRRERCRGGHEYQRESSYRAGHNSLIFFHLSFSADPPNNTSILAGMGTQSNLAISPLLLDIATRVDTYGTQSLYFDMLACETASDGICSS